MILGGGYHAGRSITPPNGNSQPLSQTMDTRLGRSVLGRHVSRSGRKSKRWRPGKDFEGFRSYLDLTLSVEIKVCLVWFGLFSSKFSKTYNCDFSSCGLGLEHRLLWSPPVLCVRVTEMDCPGWGSLNWSQQEMVTLCKALSFTMERGDAWEELGSGRWG